MIISANFHQLGGQFRFTPKGGKSQEFFIVGFAVSDTGEVTKTVTFPAIPKGSTIERHDGVNSWAPFSLEV